MGIAVVCGLLIGQEYYPQAPSQRQTGLVCTVNNTCIGCLPNCYHPQSRKEMMNYNWYYIKRPPAGTETIPLVQVFVFSPVESSGLFRVTVMYNNVGYSEVVDRTVPTQPSTIVQFQIPSVDVDVKVVVCPVRDGE